MSPEIRGLIVRARRNGYRAKDIAEIFAVSRKNVWKQDKRIYRKGGA